jgi:F0F1-type ATP synthase epsilon subunit
MNSKLSIVVVAVLLLVGVGIGVVYRQAPRQPVAAARVAATPLTPQEIKKTVALLNGSIEVGPFGVNVKAEAAETLGALGQAANDAGAVAELTKLSKNGKVQPEARAAAKAALAKLNSSAPTP